MVAPGTPGNKWFGTFVERRDYHNGIHYHRVEGVGYVFHTKSPLGDAVDEQDFAERSDFILPTWVLSHELEIC